METDSFLKIIRKKVAIIIILFIIIFTAIGGVRTFMPSVEAGNATRANYTGLDEAKYPGYNALIQKLKAEHPNWNFTILYTKLDWNQVIKSENTGHHSSPRNLISANKTGEWICSICGTKRYDNGSWCCASEKTIEYFMDPRNILNSMDIFQLEEVKYNEKIHTLEGVKKMTNGTFLEGDSIGQAILTACRNSNVSPYYVVARIKQEQGSKGSTTGKGMESEGKLYYNVFNVGASGNGSAQIIANALATAKEKGWDTLEKSIIGGIDFLKTKYINRGQNTLYLNKFDVDDSDNTLYSHQYMQNIQASQSEAVTVYNIYNQTGKLNESFNFIIPVYENMPTTISAKPNDSEIYPINVKTNDGPINVRQGPSTSTTIIGKVQKGTVILSIERNATQEGWSKVVLADGTIGYMASRYLEIVDDVTNCNEKVVLTDTGVRLRNGPGTSDTSVITTLAKGQIVTRIDKNRYEKDGLTWDRVVLADGRQGFVASKYLSLQEQQDIVTIIAHDGLRLRSGPGTNYTSIRLLANGLVVTRLEKAQTQSGGYYWDKIITPDGVIGYVARQYLAENKPAEPQNNYKKDDNARQVVMEPKTTLKDIKAKESITKAVNKDGVALQDNDLVGTGAKLTIGGKEYTAVKLGDVNGDGQVLATDALAVLKHSTNASNLKDVYLKAADTNKDGQVLAADALKILKVSTGADNLTI